MKLLSLIPLLTLFFIGCRSLDVLDLEQGLPDIVMLQSTQPNPNDYEFVRDINVKETSFSAENARTMATKKILDIAKKGNIQVLFIASYEYGPNSDSWFLNTVIIKAKAFRKLTKEKI